MYTGRKKGSTIKRKLPNVFSKEDLISFFDKCENTTVAIASLLAFTSGLRIGEVVNLKWENVNLNNGSIKIVNGKSGDGYVYFPTAIIPILQRWKYYSNGDYVIPYSIDVQPHSRAGLLTEDFHNELKRSNLYHVDHTKSDGNKVHKLTFHGFRHTFATFMWEKTGDLYAVKNAMRHSRIDTTEIYTHISNPILKQRHSEAFTPKENIVAKEIQPQEAINPIQLLKIRFAKGEIKIEDYKEMLSLLQNDITIKIS